MERIKRSQLLLSELGRSVRGVGAGRPGVHPPGVRTRAWFAHLIVSFTSISCSSTTKSNLADNAHRIHNGVCKTFVELV